MFAAPALVPSSGYSITVTKQGFAPFEVKEFEILVGQNVDFKVTLQVGTSTTQVSVEASAPIVDSTKTDVSQVVDATQIQELPINGRRVDSFVLLSPAVVPDGTFGLLSFRGVAGGNAFLTDGNDTTNQYYNENAGRTRISSQISQDAVQEFQVVSNNYSAEFGHATGGVVNTLTRSGTNDFHGTAYWFFRNQEFNAKDTFATINPQEKRNQVGASAGGKIIKDKLFYFLNYEALRQGLPSDCLDHLLPAIRCSIRPASSMATAARPSTGARPPRLSATPPFTSSIASSKPSPAPLLRIWDLPNSTGAPRSVIPSAQA